MKTLEFLRTVLVHVTDLAGGNAPFEMIVPQRVYEAVETEMKQWCEEMDKPGPLVKNDLGIRHFMLWGVPLCCGDSNDYLISMRAR